MLPVLHGHEGRLLAWALEAPARLQEIVTCGLLLNLSEKPGDVVWGDLLWTRNHPKINLAERPLRESLGRLAEDTIVALGTDASPWLLRAEERGAPGAGQDGPCEEHGASAGAGQRVRRVRPAPRRR
jgi:hypothetical protein